MDAPDRIALTPIPPIIPPIPSDLSPSLHPPHRARTRDGQVAATPAALTRATENSARARPEPDRRSTACHADGSTPTSAHAARRSLRRGRVWSRSADRRPRPAIPWPQAMLPTACPRGGDRGIAVVRRQDRDGCAVAVGETLALPALAALTRTRELAHGQRRQRFLQGDVDARAGLVAQNRMHTGTGGGEATDESRLLADRPERRLRQIVHLSGQQSGDAARIEQREIGRWIVRLRSALAERGDEDQCGADCVRRASAWGARIRAPSGSLRRQSGRRSPSGSCATTCLP